MMSMMIKTMLPPTTPPIMYLLKADPSFRVLSVMVAVVVAVVVCGINGKPELHVTLTDPEPSMMQ